MSGRDRQGYGRYSPWWRAFERGVHWSVLAVALSGSGLRAQEESEDPSVADSTVPTAVLVISQDDMRFPDHPDPAPLVLGFGDSSLDFTLRARTSKFADFMQVKSDLTGAVLTALKEAGITIPFPQRDLHVKSIDPTVRDAAPGLETASLGGDE